MATSNGPAAWAPWLRAVLLTVTLSPGAVATGVAVAVEITRSGPTVIGIAVDRSLLAWAGESTSCTEPVALARAKIQYWPGTVAGGICTPRTSGACAPPARAPTGTSPPSGTSLPTSSDGSFDRYRRETKAGAPPAAAALLCTMWVTLTLAPAVTKDGVAVTDVTRRSAFTTW